MVYVSASSSSRSGLPPPKERTWPDAGSIAGVPTTPAGTPVATHIAATSAETPG